jgi:hypothetical protein
VKKLVFALAAVAALVFVAGPAMKATAAAPGKGDNLWDAWLADVKKLQADLAGKKDDKKK